jgi:hypothetical protein
MLFMYCITLSKYNTVKTLVQNHRNDLIVNGFGLTTSLIGGHIVW